MTDRLGGDPLSGLRQLRVRYGAVAALLFLNYYVLGVLLSYIINTAVSLLPNGTELLDSGTDGGYLVFMLRNEIGAYLPLLILFLLLFGGEGNMRREIPAFTEDGYRRFPGETVLLFLAGSGLASLGSYLTNIVSELFNSLWSVPEVKTAFSSSMPDNVFRFAVFAAGTVLIAPICEEVIFRHILLRPLRRFSDNTAAFVTALLFALSHFNYSQFLYTFIFGYFLAVIAIRNGSVIPAVICHIINNITAVIQTYMPESFGSDGLDSFFGSIADAVDLYAGISFYLCAAAAIFAIILGLLRLKNNCPIPVRQQYAVLFTDPLLLAGVGICLCAAFLNLYL